MRPTTILKTIAAAGVIAAASLFATTGAWAQFGGATVEDTAATATILDTINLGQTSPLAFGAISAITAAGSCTLNPLTDAVGCTSATDDDAGVPAAYAVSAGTPNAGYHITLPLVDVVLNGPGGSTMNANAFTASVTTEAAGAVQTAVTPPVGTLTAGGADTFKVGATLNYSLTQQTGSYSGLFNVTVLYP